MLDLGKIVNLTANGTLEDLEETTTQLPYIPVGLEVTHLPVDNGSASTGFMILAGCMVWFMVPGLALFYSGLSRHTNALSLMMLCMQGMAVVIVQYFLFGFSLAWGLKGRTFVGDFYSGAYNNLYTHSFPNTSPQIPAISFAFFQMMAANIAAALIFGSVPERARFAPAMVFVFCWTTFVYDFTSFWEWADYG
ncbi:hypothetical protein RvY_08064 [Ramazzottius varieornatus]|uniref:Ammonium transporter AmtB-like domain-containing protein n=1 Tax=Ramazzottius varieornatus TaxID=947166 RepID=A0A1D1V4G0_RAMVA|nr:hypothetical protein RvY_08064 [Ramazzottius varieornatus]